MLPAGGVTQPREISIAGNLVSRNPAEQKALAPKVGVEPTRAVRPNGV